MKTTIYDVAKAMNLSPGTISKILHNNGNVSIETRKRVLEYIKEVGYVADTSARILKSKHSWTIGVIFADISLIGLEHPFFASIIQHFKNYIEKEGYEIVFIVNKLGENELTYLEWAKNKKVDGVLIVSGNINNKNIIELVESGIPCVSTDIIMHNLNSVMSDDFMGIRLGIEYALEHQMSKVACIVGPLTSRAFAERLTAYDTLMKTHQLPLFEHFFEEAESFGYTSGYNATKRMFSKIDVVPDVILSFSDDLAFGVVRALQDMGYRVPEDIGVIGFDDIQFAKHFSPALSTIRQNKIEIAQSAAKMLLDMIQGKLEERNVVKRIPVELVIRESL